MVRLNKKINEPSIRQLYEEDQYVAKMSEYKAAREAFDNSEKKGEAPPKEVELWEDVPANAIIKGEYFDNSTPTPSL